MTTMYRLVAQIHTACLDQGTLLGLMQPLLVVLLATW
jgi:hypothetical protein